MKIREDAGLAFLAETEALAADIDGGREVQQVVEDGGGVRRGRWCAGRDLVQGALTVTGSLGVALEQVVPLSAMQTR